MVISNLPSKLSLSFLRLVGDVLFATLELRAVFVTSSARDTCQPVLHGVNCLVRTIEDNERVCFLLRHLATNATIRRSDNTSTTLLRSLVTRAYKAGLGLNLSLSLVSVGGNSVRKSQNGYGEQLS